MPTGQYALTDAQPIGQFSLADAAPVTPFTRRGGMSDPAMASPEVFTSSNEKDAAGNAVVRPEAGWNDYEAIPAWIRWIGEHGPAEVRKGVLDMIHGNYAAGARRAVAGGGITAAAAAAPALAEGLVFAPAATLTGLVGGATVGTGATAVGTEAGRLAGLTDDQAALVGDALGLVGGIKGAQWAPAAVQAARNLPRPSAAQVLRVIEKGPIRGTAGALADMLERRAATTALPAATPAAAAPPTETPDQWFDRIVGEGRAMGRTQAAAPEAASAAPRPAPAPPPAPVIVPAESPAPSPVAAAPVAAAPASAARPAAPALRATGRWGPGDSVNALRDAAAQAGYPISDGELKVAWPSVQAAGADGGPAVAALHVERMQAARSANAASRPPIAAPQQTVRLAPAAAAVTEPAAPVPLLGTEAAPASAAGAGAQAVAPAPSTPTPTPTVAPVPSASAAPARTPSLSGARAEAAVWQAAQRAGLERVANGDVEAAGRFVQQGVAPDEALARVLAGERAAAPVVSASAAAAQPLSEAQAAAAVWRAAAQANLERVTLSDVHAAGRLVQQGRTPADALVEVLSGRGAAGAPATGDALAAELAARLGTPTTAASEAAIDARWRRGELKTPSAPTAQRMAADADVQAPPPVAVGTARQLTAPDDAGITFQALAKLMYTPEGQALLNRALTLSARAPTRPNVAATRAAWEAVANATKGVR